MTIDWNVVATGLVAPVAVLVVYTILDFKLAPFFVKWYWWIPVRGIARTKPPKIGGEWEQTWEPAGSAGFAEPSSRHSHPKIRQWGSYCYAEFISKGVTYVVFGKIVNDHFVGDWYDKKDPHGYFGAFQLQIINTSTMRGRWLGHSKSNHEVKSDEWNWRRVEK